MIITLYYDVKKITAQCISLGPNNVQNAEELPSVMKLEVNEILIALMKHTGCLQFQENGHTSEMKRVIKIIRNSTW